MSSNEYTPRASRREPAWHCCGGSSRIRYEALPSRKRYYETHGFPAESSNGPQTHRGEHCMHQTRNRTVRRLILATFRNFLTVSRGRSVRRFKSFKAEDGSVAHRQMCRLCSSKRIWYHPGATQPRYGRIRICCDWWKSIPLLQRRMG